MTIMDHIEKLEAIHRALTVEHNALIVEGLVKHGGSGMDGSRVLQSALYHINSTLAHLRKTVVP